MLLFLTNDDGIDGEGLKVLAERLSKEHEVWIIAPDRNRSGVSSCISLSKKLKLTKIQDRIYKYEGSPADCTILASRGAGKILPRLPDAVISGINRGANIGTDLVYSGTAAAARQGVINGIPSIALSIDSPDEEYHFEQLADFAAKNLEKLISLCEVAPSAFNQKKRCVFVNVNAESSAKAYKGVKMTDIAFREYNDSIERTDLDEKTALCGVIPGNLHTSGINYSDYDAVREGFISVSRVVAEPESAGIVDGISFSL